MGKKRNVIYDDAYLKYKEGYSLSQVALMIGVARQTVFKAFQRRGFKLRGVNFNVDSQFKPEPK